MIEPKGVRVKLPEGSMGQLSVVAVSLSDVSLSASMNLFKGEERPRRSGADYYIIKSKGRGVDKYSNQITTLPTPTLWRRKSGPTPFKTPDKKPMFRFAERIGVLNFPIVNFFTPYRPSLFQQRPTSRKKSLCWPIGRIYSESLSGKPPLHGKYNQNRLHHGHNILMFRQIGQTYFSFHISSALAKSTPRD